MVERGDEENAVETAKFISWSRRSRESLAEVRRGYSWGDDDEQELKEVDISLMNRLDVLASGMQKEGERGFWELLGRHIVFIPFEEFPSSSGLVQAVVQSPRLFHIHIFESQERQFDHGWSSHS